MKLLRLLICGALSLPGLLWAHGDDDHGAIAAASAAGPIQTLRVEASSELFELVGSLQGAQLVIHLDRFNSNEPVTGAKISAEGGPLKATAAIEKGGVYTVAAAGLAAPGTHPLVFTVQAGDASDLLTGDLVVASSAAAAAAAHSHSIEWPSFTKLALAVLGLVLILGAGVFAWRRRRTTPHGAF